jgi:2-keto-4-pentenoate hydratase
MTAADWIVARRLAGEAVADLPAHLRPESDDAAYGIQAEVLERLRAAGWGRRVGWKVGVTTPQMRAALGIDAPIGGAMLSGGRREPGTTIAHAAFCRVGIECEIGMILRTCLGGAGVVVDRDAATAAVATLHPAIELVDDRYRGAYQQVGVPTIIADDAFHAGFVLGPPVADWADIDLGAVRGVTRANGTVRGEGRGADVQGHPMLSLAWIANRLGALGHRLEAGDIVLTGSLPVPYWAAAGDAVEIEIERLGTLHLTVS